MNYSIDIVSLHKGFCMFILVAKIVVLILQLKFDQLFSVPIEQLSPME
jgi:hypothetical protein